MFVNRITITIPHDIKTEYEDQYLNDRIGNLCFGQLHGYAKYRRLVKVEHVDSHTVVIYYESVDRFKIPGGMELRIDKKEDAPVDTGKGAEKVLASGSKRGKGLGNKELSA